MSFSHAAAGAHVSSPGPLQALDRRLLTSAMVGSTMCWAAGRRSAAMAVIAGLGSGSSRARLMPFAASSPACVLLIAVEDAWDALPVAEHVPDIFSDHCDSKDTCEAAS
ncbi:hypothetical protein DFJ73DRAFT_774473 [Zopfochytrium polystomum]|nr:hypothetical protein DFJ73DRAFT_774473 [Zopfochytrium polystomum]